MANKKITDLQLRSSVTDDLNIPSDDSIQSYRVTALQFKDYILPNGAVTAAKLATDAVETAKIKDGNVTLSKLVAALQTAFVPSGAVLPFAGSTAPTGFLLCDGAAVSRTTYADLFAVIASKHGSGNGSTTFNLPDYRGRFLRGVDGATGRDPNAGARTAMATGGNTGDNVGSVQGHAAQGHRHQWLVGNGTDAASGNPRGLQPNGTYFTSSGDPVSDTTNGTPQISSENRPINANVNYIIKT